MGHLWGEPALGGRARPTCAAGWVVHQRREEPERFAPAHHRQRGRSPVPRRGPRPHCRAIARTGDRHRLVDRDREGLLSRPGERPAQLRASGYRARSCRSRATTERGGTDRCGARRAPQVRREGFHGPLLRQSAAQRRAASGSSAGVCRGTRSGACALDRGQRGISIDHGRPHRSGDDRRRHR